MTDCPPTSRLTQIQQRLANPFGKYVYATSGEDETGPWVRQTPTADVRWLLTRHQQLQAVADTARAHVAYTRTTTLYALRDALAALTRGRRNPRAFHERHPHIQRALCRVGRHPNGATWDHTDFRLGRSWSNCDACGRWWE